MDLDGSLGVRMGIAANDLEQVVCDRCARSDHTLRVAAFPYVVSSLASTSERVLTGLFCETCRAFASARATAISLAGGWWSLGGPVATVRAVGVNLRGGAQSAEQNAELHRRIGARRWQEGDLAAAALSLRVAQTLAPRQETSRSLWTLAKAGYKAAPRASLVRFAPAVPLAFFSIIVLLLADGLLNTPPERAITAAAASATGAGAKRSGENSALTAAKAAAAAAAARDAIAKDLAQLRSLAHRHRAMAQKADRGSPDVLSEMAQVARRIAAATPSTTSNADHARLYLTSRLLLMSADLTERVVSGDEISTVARDVASLELDAVVQPLLKRESIAARFRKLNDVLGGASAHYRSGGHVDAIQRTTGESLGGLVDVEVSRLIAVVSGSDLADALEREAGARAISISDSLVELKIRAMILAAAEGAFRDCLDHVDTVPRR